MEDERILAVGGGSSSELCRERFGVPGNVMRHGGVAFVEPVMGEGRGVRSFMAARYGEGRADPGDVDEAMLEVERVLRRLEPRMGALEGDVIAWCTFGSRVRAGDSYKKIGAGPLGTAGMLTLVRMWRVAPPGEILRWARRSRQ